MPSRNHSRVAHNLSVALNRFRARFSIHQQLALRLDDWPTIPDVCLFPVGILPTDWLSDEDECAIPPALVIEILSPKQNLQPLVDQVREYLRHGVKSCWIVIPVTETVSVFPAATGSRSFSEGNLRDEPLGIEIAMTEIFA